jgi:transcriptional regulator with XRE-family HTH domain
MTIKFDKNKLLSDPKVKKAYDEMNPDFIIAAALINARVKAKLTQAEVAKKMGTTQSVVARLESGHHHPSLKSIQKYAHAINRKISLEIRP